MAKEKVLINYILKDMRDMTIECYPERKDNPKLKLSSKQQKSIILALYNAILQKIEVEWDWNNLCEMEVDGITKAYPSRYFKRKSIDIDWIIKEIKFIVHTNHLK